MYYNNYVSKYCSGVVLYMDVVSVDNVNVECISKQFVVYVVDGDRGRLKFINCMVESGLLVS